MSVNPTVNYFTIHFKFESDMSTNEVSKVSPIVATIVGALSAVIIALFAALGILPSKIFYSVVILLSISLLIAVSFGFLKPIIDKKLGKKKALVGQLKSCKSHVEWAIDRIKKDEWEYPPDIPHLNFCPELNRKVIEFVESYQRCADLFIACKYAIRSESEKCAEASVPNTHKSRHLDKMITKKSEFVIQFVNGKKVIKNWIEENFPGIHENIIQNLEESESALDRFFLDLNRMLKNNRVLNRFRKEKKNLIELAEIIQKS